MAENDTLGNYRVLKLIGDGGFAKVYLGEHLYLKTFAAIKVPKLQLDSGDLEDFLNEARRGVGLRHPNVLRTLECGVEGGTQPYIVMDYAPGGSLRRRYPPGTIVPPLAIITYARQAGVGLQYIHDQGLIHQDIKPGNMMLGSNDELMLGDFGIAVVAHRTATQSMSDAAGTSRYMAPEQFLGRTRPASDQYALAIVIYEWICGSPPFTGDIAELYYKHTHVAPPPLHEKVPAISPAVEQVIMKALAKDPRDRFLSVQDFVTALEQAGRPGISSTLPRVSGPISVPGMGMSGPIPRVSGPMSVPGMSGPIPVPPPAPAPAPDSFRTRVEEDVPTVEAQQPRGSRRLSPETPPPPVGGEFNTPSGETIVPTIISQRNMSSPGMGVPPTIPAYPIDTPRGMPAYAPYQVAPPPVAPQSQRPNAGGRRPSQRTVILLLTLVIILLGGVLGFYLFANHGGPGSKGGPTATTTGQAQKHINPTPIPPYSPMFGFNARHTHFVSEETTLGTSNVVGLGSTPAWKIAADDSIRSSPVVANGIAYITSQVNSLYAVNIATKTQLWQVSAGTFTNGEPSFIYSTPAISNGVLYVGSNDHHVYAFNAVTGTSVWTSLPTGGAIYSSPSVVNNVVYVGSLDHNVYAYNAANGHVLWKLQTGGPVFSSPAVVNNVVYIGSDDNTLYAIDSSSGTVLWRWAGPANNKIDSSPTVVDGMVYVSDSDSTIYAFDVNGCGQSSCSPVWTAQTGGYMYSSPAVANRILYVGAGDGKLGKLYAFDTVQCLNATSGCQPIWTAPTAQPIESSPTVANGVVYVGSKDGKIYAFNAQSGAQLWSFATGGQVISSPLVLNGVLYIGSLDHNLYAFHL